MPSCLWNFDFGWIGSEFWEFLWLEAIQEVFRGFVCNPHLVHLGEVPRPFVCIGWMFFDDVRLAGFFRNVVQNVFDVIRRCLNCSQMFCVGRVEEMIVWIAPNLKFNYKFVQSFVFDFVVVVFVDVESLIEAILAGICFRSEIYIF